MLTVQVAAVEGPPAEAQRHIFYTVEKESISKVGFVGISLDWKL
jgi:hypothetical protein